MSQENVELVRRVFAAINQGVEATRRMADEIMAPDVELRASGRLPDAGIAASGREALRSWWRQLVEVVDLRYEVDEYIDAGDAVVAVTRQFARGVASGAETRNRIVTVIRIREGKVTHVVAYGSKRQALEAVGLRESQAETHPPLSS